MEGNLPSVSAMLFLVELFVNPVSMIIRSYFVRCFGLAKTISYRNRKPEQKNRAELDFARVNRIAWQIEFTKSKFHFETPEKEFTFALRRHQILVAFVYIMNYYRIYYNSNIF